jgi:hypothetical protein
MSQTRNIPTESPIEVIDFNRPDEIDEVSSEKSYMRYLTPGRMVEGEFIEDTDSKTLICRVLASGTITTTSAAYAKWSDRAEASTVWVPWSKRNIIIK